MPAPYDGRFKLLAEEFPGLLLRLLGIVEPGCSLETIDVLRELQLDPVQVDHVYKIGNDRLVHFEAITSWRADRVPKLALYRFLLHQKFALPMDSYLVLMAERYAPRTLPERIVYEEHDGFRIETPYRVIRLWEIDPAIAFEPGCEALLPWVPALNSGTDDLVRATEAIQHLSEHPDQAPYAVDTMIGNLAVLASLRYDKLEIRKLLEKLQRKIMLSTDLFTDSWLYKDGKAEGEAIGEAKGKLEGQREDLRTAFQLRFPEAPLPPEIETLTNLDAIQQAFRAVLQARASHEAITAIQQAVQ
ncbi:MAG: Rpn family recombination-promoting nuclease/putative transposase [Acidobacteria bacterium]|nr:Rpn family recombination-promoting nuclease/putative transposase [Acidobacteriota bacterium]